MKKILLYITFALSLYNINAQDLDIDINNQDQFYHRVNSGQLLPADKDTISYLLDNYVLRVKKVEKTFRDANGTNLLNITVINPCDKDASPDGMVCSIDVKLKNKNHTDSLKYYNPYVQMSLFNLDEKQISLILIEKKKMVIIPFTYCGNADDDFYVCCITLYNHKTYFNKILYTGVNFQNYKLDKDSLNEKLEELPKLIRNDFKKFATAYEKTINKNLDD